MGDREGSGFQMEPGSVWDRVRRDLGSVWDRIGEIQVLCEMESGRSRFYGG